MPNPAATDHRTRVAAERRERTRTRLLESALWVFGERGVGASVVQEVIAHAEVAQGTFYNYFRTNEDLLIALSEELNNELMEAIEGVVGDLVDAGKRIASGIRLYLHTAREYPLFAKFVAAAGLHVAGPTSRVYEYLPKHIAAGQRSGRFADMPAGVALDLIAGTTLAAVQRMVSGNTPRDYPEQVVTVILRGLGVPAGQAAKLVQIPFPPIQPAPGSLLARAHQKGLGV